MSIALNDAKGEKNDGKRKHFLVEAHTSNSQSIFRQRSLFAILTVSHCQRSLCHCFYLSLPLSLSLSVCLYLSFLLFNRINQY